MMKRLLIVCIIGCVGCGIGCAQQDCTAAVESAALRVSTLIREAQANYDAGQYLRSAELYEAIATHTGTSPALYYNLGNAYYKQKDYARAILNYERCLLLNPADADAKANLELARMQTVDKIETIETPIFETWSCAVRDGLSCQAWSWVAIGFFGLFIVCLFLYFFMHRIVVRKVGFYGALVALLASLVGIFYAREQSKRLTQRDYAIVMAPTVTVRSSPAESGTQLFPIHEGTKVRVRQSLGEWVEIELSDGNVGWMPAGDMERI